MRRWPLMRRHTHMRPHVVQGEAYRREIQEARREAERARAELQRYVDSLAPRIHTQRDIPTGNLHILIEVERQLMEREPQSELLRRVSDSIMRRLVDSGHDYRGDLRQTPAQRALRP